MSADGATNGTEGHDKVVEAVRRAAERERQGEADPEPSLARRLGQIGLLGWTILVPTMLGVVAGRLLDRSFGTGIFFSAPFIMIGAGVGLWLAFRWMDRA